ncbi:MAG: MATE family efflux transporter [Candidatus Enteromonas sp.]
MHVALSEHLTGKKIFLVTIAPICMMVFSSLYSVVDGVFISQWVGLDAFAGNNLVWPYIAILSSFGLMFGTGGSALIGKYLGEGKKEKADQTFSFMIIATLILGVGLGILGFFTSGLFTQAMAQLTSDSTEEMVRAGTIYGQILSIGVPLLMLQFLFQSFFTVAEKPYVGFAFIVGAGISNIALDALFMGVFGWGIEGAAVATVIGYFIGGAAPILYFLFSKKTPIRWVKPVFDGKDLAKAAGNGISELVSNISGSVLAMCYNAQLLRYVGQDGVSAYGVIQYFVYVFIAVFIGYSMGVAPFVSYNFGAQNKKELHHILVRSLCVVAVLGVCMFAFGEFLGPVLSAAFAGDNKNVAALAGHATRIHSFVFLTCGFSIFGSSFFTALNNGMVSGVISLFRTFVCELACVFLMPLILSIDGIWASGTFAEIGSSALTVFFYIWGKKKYGY